MSLANAFLDMEGGFCNSDLDIFTGPDSLPCPLGFGLGLFVVILELVCIQYMMYIYLHAVKYTCVFTVFVPVVVCYYGPYKYSAAAGTQHGEYRARCGHAHTTTQF